ncbi:probable BOI-related E3 ubiquitin-protein ligase 2 isoform X2 [Phalaenopsis equestris]|nr:probable BOI-related E3 ubiquitin-protein ligase 2 isoform X2 [Phalaenopsis equestris]
MKLKVSDNNEASVLNIPIKRSPESVDIATQNNLQISFNNLFRDEMDRSRSIPQVNTVSTGLRLSYDDEERHSSLTTASGSMSSLPFPTTVLDNLRPEIKNQNEEFNRFFRFQEEQFAKGLTEMKQRHITSFVNLIDQELSQKLRAKDMEIESINRKNCELADQIHQASAEAQTWQQRAQYNESIVHALRTSLQQAVAQGAAATAAAANWGREGCGESEVDDAASSFYPNSVRGGEKRVLTMACKGCKGGESCMLLLPCRHLCLCRDCDALVDSCPVCFIRKTASVEVYMS